MRDHIHIIKTGGTIEFIDSGYEAINMKLLKIDTTVDSYLRAIIQPHFDFSVASLFSKDSRMIDETDRESIKSEIQDTPHNKILITHGTFTMCETAQYLKGLFADKIIILTGSMIPITGFAASDAGFNLGYAAASFRYLSPGVYIAANAEIFDPDEVQKNTELLRFE